MYGCLNTHIHKSGIKNDRFLSFIKRSLSTASFEGKDQIPQVVDNKTNTLALGGWEFDIIRTVYSTPI
jgi:hypothetical protein